MDNAHEPRANIPISQVQLTFWKVEHAIGGLYLWEYFTTLDYERRVIQGHLPYRWTIWLYSIARLAALISVILSFVTMDATTAPINCQLWVLFAVTFLCMASISASLLIVLRTVAIWNRNKVIMTLAIIVLGASIGFHLHNISLVRATWSTQLACVPAKSNFSALGFVPTIITDIALLLIILAGLLVMRYRGGGMFGLTRLLWKHGVIWLVLGFAAEVPPLVFTFAHLNDQLRTLFEVPSEIILIIAATRMHRSLVDFAFGSSDVVHGSPQTSNLVSSKTKRTSTPSSPSSALDHVEVAIHMTTESHPSSLTKGDDSSTIVSTSEQTSQIVGNPSTYSADTKPSYAV